MDIGIFFCTHGLLNPVEKIIKYGHPSNLRYTFWSGILSGAVSLFVEIFFKKCQLRLGHMYEGCLFVYVFTNRLHCHQRNNVVTICLSFQINGF